MPQQTPRVTQTLLDEPHIEGRRLSVLQVRDRVKDLGQEPEAVAEEFDLDVADVYSALAYYYANPDVMDDVRGTRSSELTELRRDIAESRPDGVSPPS